MGQALYRKYRTKTFAETVGQEHITTTLENAIKQGRISHAYLLSGPRGTGKTSIARILAHEINGLPYDDETHLDIIEIDAASNRRIDEIRDIRERVSVAPASAKYKVYIIDEVHMLTKEAFNALLKTLEEPPAHVVFVLATTEAHKLPDTIVSRTQRYSLRPVPLDKVVGHLRTIATGEKLKIDDDALRLIAEHGEGSFRDSISLLDQASNTSEHITRADVERILGLAPEIHIKQLSSALTETNSGGVVATLAELYNLGFEPAMVARQLSAQLRQTILDSTSTNPQADLALLRKLLDVSAARNPKQLLELTLLQSALPIASPAAVIPRPATAPVAPPATISKSKELPLQSSESPPKASPEAAKQTLSPSQPVAHAAGPLDNGTSDPPIASAKLAQPAVEVDVTDLWHQVLEDIKKQYNTLYGIARMAQPTFNGSQLTLAFKFSFHQKRMNEVKNRQIFADTASRLYGSPVEIICIITEPDIPVPAQPDVTAISNIFGGAELLP